MKVFDFRIKEKHKFTLIDKQIVKISEIIDFLT